MSVLKASVGVALFVVAATLAWTSGRSVGQSSAGLQAITSTPTQTPAMRGGARDGWQRIVDGSAASASSAVSRAVPVHQPPSSLPAGPFGANIDELKRRAG